jgi:hypothetical protein
MNIFKSKINIKFFILIVVVFILGLLIFFYTTQPVILSVEIGQYFRSYPQGTEQTIMDQPFETEVSRIVGKQVHFEGLEYTPGYTTGEVSQQDPAQAEMVPSLVIANYPLALEYKKQITQDISEKKLGRIVVEVSSPISYFFDIFR